MNTVRAKFMCVSESLTSFARNAEPTREYVFQAVYDPDVAEDQRYAKYTPTGRLTMQVDNSAVVFVPGQYYHLDISKVEP